MKKSIWDQQHLMDYTLYGLLSGIFFSITVWLYLYDPEFRQISVIYFGSGLFAFIIFLYILKLTRGANKDSRRIIFAGLLSAVAGILVSLTLCYFLCFVYKPEVFAVRALSSKPATASLYHVFMPAIVVNFFAGSFISLLIGYIFKWNLLAKTK